MAARRLGPVWGLVCLVALAALALPGPSDSAELTAAARIERLKALLLHGHTHGYTAHAQQARTVADPRRPRILLELGSSHSHSHSHTHPHSHRALPHPDHEDDEGEEEPQSAHLRRTDAIDAHEFQQDVDAALDDPEGMSLLELASQIKAQQQARQRASASTSATSKLRVGDDPKPSAKPSAKHAGKAPGKHAAGGMAKGPAGLTNDCKIDYVEVKVHEEKEIDPASKYKSAQDVVKHLLYYAGSITDHSGKPTKSGVHAGRMAHPKQVPWVDTRKYHFECCDGRGDHAMLGAPGGDLAEFALALNAFEHTKGLSDALDQKRVDVYFRDYLGEIDGQFYGHTDAIGWFQWSAELKKKVGQSNPLKLDTPDKKEVALSLAPQFYGCSHVQMMIGKEDAYRVRADLVRQVIRAFFTVLMDEGNILRSKLEFAILTGYPNREQGIVNIMSPGPSAKAARGKAEGKEEGKDKKEKKEDPRLKGCFYRAPLMVPRLNLSPEQSLGIIHPRAIYEKRAVYTEYLTRQEKKDEAWKWKLFALMNDIGKAQLTESKKTLWDDKTKYVAEFKFE